MGALGVHCCNNLQHYFIIVIIYCYFVTPLKVFYQFLGVPDFQTGGNFIAHDSTVGSVSRHNFHFPWLAMTVTLGFFHSVFVMLAWSNSKSLPKFQYTIEQLAWHRDVTHSYDVSHLSHLGSDNQGLDAGGNLVIQDSRLETWSSQWIPRMEQRVHMWNFYNCLMCLQCRVQDLHPYRREKVTTAMHTFSFVEIWWLYWLSALIYSHLSAWLVLLILESISLSKGPSLEITLKSTWSC